MSRFLQLCLTVVMSISQAAVAQDGNEAFVSEHVAVFEEIKRLLDSHSFDSAAALRQASESDLGYFEPGAFYFSLGVMRRDDLIEELILLEKHPRHVRHARFHVYAVAGRTKELFELIENYEIEESNSLGLHLSYVFLNSLITRNSDQVEAILWNSKIDSVYKRDMIKSSLMAAHWFKDQAALDILERFVDPVECRNYIDRYEDIFEEKIFRLHDFSRQIGGFHWSRVLGLETPTLLLSSVDQPERVIDGDDLAAAVELYKVTMSGDEASDEILDRVKSSQEYHALWAIYHARKGDCETLTKDWSKDSKESKQILAEFAGLISCDFEQAARRLQDFKDPNLRQTAMVYFEVVPNSWTTDREI